MGEKSTRVWTPFTTERRETFLAALREVPNVTYAAKQAGVTKQTAYNYRKQDSDFAEAWDAALEEGIDMIELEAHRRAVQGWEEPILYMGQVVTTVTKYSDTLMARLLQAHRPEKYSEKHQHSVTPNDPVAQALAAIDGTTMGPPAMREGGTLPEPKGRTFDHVLPGEEEEPPEDGETS